MFCKIFSHQREDIIEKDVNEWLSEHPFAEILHIEQTVANEPEESSWIMITIFYEEEGDNSQKVVK